MFSWNDLYECVIEVVNLFCSLGVGLIDVVVYLLFNVIEMLVVLLVGVMVGIVNLINLLLEVE